jgi:hypothetical protein
MTMRTQELFGFATLFSCCVEARFTAEQVTIGLHLGDR